MKEAVAAVQEEHARQQKKEPLGSKRRIRRSTLGSETRSRRSRHQRREASTRHLTIKWRT
jgi:hypothetical protein